MRGNEVEVSVEIGAKRNERNAETEWTRMNEATECTLAIKTTYALFFTAPLKKGGWGAWFWGVWVGKKYGFHFIKMAMVLAI